MGTPGRPRCSKLCCREGAESILRLYYISGLTSNQISEKLEVSSTHIVQRLHKLGVNLRGRGTYGRRIDGSSRKGKLWEISERELYTTPLKELALKYHFNISSVKRVRYERKNKDSDA